MAGIRFANSMKALRVARPRALPHQQRTFIAAVPLRAHQGYGDGKGNPVSEHPEKQPPHTKAQESSEHPGPAAPDVGQGSTNTSTQRQGQSPEEASAQSGGARSKEAAETGSSPTGGEIPDNSGNGTANGGEALKGPQGENAPKPKILNQSVNSVKSGLTDEQKAEVEQHNKDFEKRHDQAESAPSDKVDKKFWSGVGGRTGTENDWNA